VTLAPEDRFEDELEDEAEETASTGTDPSGRRPRSFQKFGPTALWLLAAVLVPLLLLGSMSWLDGLQKTATPAPAIGQPGGPDAERPLRHLEPLPRTRPGYAPESDGS